MYRVSRFGCAPLLPLLLPQPVRLAAVPIASAEFSTGRAAVSSSTLAFLTKTYPRVDPTLLASRVLDGDAAAARVMTSVAQQVAALKAERGITPGLAVILVGNRPDSEKYVGKKESCARACGMNSWVVRMSADSTEAQVEAKVQELIADPSVHGLLIQLPLPPHLNQKRVLSFVSAHKDVDGLHPENMGNLVRLGEELRQAKRPFTITEMRNAPCTPSGCIELLTQAGVDFEGKSAVVIGRSNIVGLPMALMLMHKNAIVTVVHSRCKDLPAVVRSADIVVAAIGVPHFVKAEWVKPGAVVVDVGINVSAEGKLVGDVDFGGVISVASLITPVPRGVGPMTVAMLLQNTVNNVPKS